MEVSSSPTTMLTNIMVGAERRVFSVVQVVQLGRLRLSRVMVRAVEGSGSRHGGATEVNQAPAVGHGVWGGRMLGEIIGDRRVVKVARRVIRLPLRNDTSQTCPT